MYQYSTGLRDARLNAIAKAVGAGPTLKMFSGPEPISCEHPDPQRLLVSMQLPRQWLSPATDGIVTKLGEWSATASDVGRIGCFRICDQRGTCHLQCSISAAGGRGDMTVNDTVVVPGQRVVVDQFAIVGAGRPPTTAVKPTTTIDDDDIDEVLDAINDIVADGTRLKFDKPLREEIVRDGTPLKFSQPLKESK